MLPFVSCHMEYNDEMIYFHMKGRHVQVLFFLKIAFEKCTTNFYFKNSEVGIKI